MSNDDRPTPPNAYQTFTEHHPNVLKAYEALGKAVRDDGPLSDREVALVKLAIAVGARMEGATHAHCRNAMAAGIDEADLRQVALLAIPTVGFPNMMAAMTWINDSLARASED